MFTEANGSHVSKHEKGEAGANPKVLAMEVGFNLHIYINKCCVFLHLSTERAWEQ